MIGKQPFRGDTLRTLYPGNLASGLLAAWNFEENGGARADATGNAHTLTETGAVGRAAGIVSFGASFPGAATNILSIAAANATIFKPGASSFSLSFWVFLTSLAANQEVFSVANATGNQREWAAGFTTTGNALRIRSFRDGINAEQTTGSAISTNTWVHCAVGIDRANGPITGRANTQWIAMNGVVVATTALVSSSLFASTADFIVGAQNAGVGSPLNGRVDAALWWGRTLTRLEIARLYNGGAGRQYPV